MLKIITALIGLILLGFFGRRLIISFERGHLYHPSAELEGDPSEVGLDYQDINLRHPDGPRLHGWYIPAEAAVGTVLFCHGNAGNISHRLESIRALHELGLNVCIFDYRGYGKSSGRPDEEGTYRDARLFYDYLLETGRRENEIILFGRSLGGAVAIELAKRVSPRALICEAAFTSTVEMAGLLFPALPAKLFVVDRYESIRKVADLTLPKLFVASREDELVPLAMGRRLYRAAGEPKEFFQVRGGHADGLVVDGARYRRRLRNFLAGRENKSPD